MKTILFGAAIVLMSGTAMAATVTDKSMDKPAATRLASKPFDAPKPDDALKAADPTKVIEASTKAGPETAAAEIPSTTAMTGMGGPDEPDAALPPPVRAFSANDYPPCTSRADDNCIQLYEPGVRQSLAAFQASHGLTQTGMGGPEEPVDVADDGADAETAAYEPLPEDAVMPATEDMAALPAKGSDTPAAI